ncbi:MAG TPA: sulfotransferase domain-containing protein [Phycisphaeraceae bacterium]
MLFASPPYSLEHPPVTQRLRAQLRRTAPVRWIYRWRRNRMADVFVLSFPKCGRTWLHVMLGKAIALHHGLEVPGVVDLKKLPAQCPGLVRIRFKHDDNPHFKAPNELVARKDEYRDRRVVLLVRDLRDTVVSAYFQMTKRESRYRFDGSLDAFLHCPRGSIDTMIRFYQIWADQRHVPAGFLLVRYEDLHADAAGQLQRVLDFVGLTGVEDQVIRQAVEFASFQNMRRLERAGTATTSRLRPGDPSDPESYKTRRGKVGGYVDYLSPEQVALLDRRIAQELPAFYGYGPQPAAEPVETGPGTSSAQPVG